MADDDYQYDVFFSYRRDPLIQDWIMEVVTRLRFRLTQDLGGEPARIFWDRDIELGDIWPEKLRDALQKSKCLVAIWSPSYFQSAWCLSEWQSFREREKRFAAPPRLIAPIKYHDGEHFPEEARRVQWDDFSPYTATVRAFWDTPRALDFDDRIRDFSASVARIVKGVPAFVPDWPLVDAKPVAPPHVALRRL